MTQTRIDFADAELYLAQRLKDHRAFDGANSSATRQEAFRAMIVKAGLGCAIIGRAPSNKPETYADFFQRLYGAPLSAKRKGKAHAHD